MRVIWLISPDVPISHNYRRIRSSRRFVMINCSVAILISSSVAVQRMANKASVPLVPFILVGSFPLPIAFLNALAYHLMKTQHLRDAYPWSSNIFLKTRLLSSWYARAGGVLMPAICLFNLLYLCDNYYAADAMLDDKVPVQCYMFLHQIPPANTMMYCLIAPLLFFHYNLRFRDYYKSEFTTSDASFFLLVSIHLTTCSFSFSLPPPVCFLMWLFLVIIAIKLSFYTQGTQDIFLGE